MHARLLLGLVPEDVKKSADLGEIARRLNEYQRLTADSHDMSLHPQLRHESRIRAAEVLSAPVVPGRTAAVRKAKADDGNDPVVLFDADGRVLGICDPSDILPVDGATPTGELTPQPPGEAGIPAQDVAKSAGRVVVYDQWRRPYLVRKAAIRTNIRKAPADLVTVYDSAGRPYTVNRGVLGSPETQARDLGPVKAGGTTGMGQPRKTGPAGSLPADGPQRAVPGDLADRQVIKSLGPQWTPVYDYTRRLAGAVKQSDIIALPPGRVLKGRAAQTHANVYDSSRRLVGVAKLADITTLAALRAGSGARRQPGR